jgi:hypothetical protein
MLKDSSNPHCGEALAYSLVATGDFDAGRRALSNLVRNLTHPEARPWEREIRDRASTLGAVLNKSPQAAQALLVEWEVDTIMALDLDELA